MSRNHFTGLDGLRGVAALAVLFYHRRYWIPGEHFFDHGFLAVDFFFALSGFVIAHAYRDRLLAGMSLREFVRLRAIRLYPLIAFGAALGGGCWLFYASYKGTELDWTFPLALAANIVALPSPVPATFDPAPIFPINEPSWSLFFELLANLAFAGLAPFLTRRVLLAIIVVSFIVLVWLTKPFGGFYYGNFLSGFPRTSFSFSLGILIYTLHRDRLLPPIRLGFVPLSIVLLAVFSPVKHWGGDFYEFACVVVVFPLVLTAGAQNEPNGAVARVAAWSGALSYPVYVLHLPLLRFADVLWGGTWQRLFGMAVLIVAVAFLVLKLYDEPMRRWLSRGSRREISMRPFPS